MGAKIKESLPLFLHTRYITCISVKKKTRKKNLWHTLGLGSLINHADSEMQVGGFKRCCLID